MKTDWFPSPAAYPEGRLFSLDLLRGLDMFYLAVVATILKPLFLALGAGPAWCRFFCSHPWEGFTLYDLIMPLFIFMCGAAIPLALGRRMVGGRPAPGFWGHVWSRFALLWFLGMLAQGNLATLDIHRISPYNNTLQTIAVGYVVAAWVMTLRSWSLRIAISVILTIAYGLFIHLGGDYTVEGNIARRAEVAFLNAFMPADNTATAGIAKGSYTWFVTSPMFPVITLAGSFSTVILSRKDLGEWSRAFRLFVLGVVSLVVGWTLAFAGVRMVKHIFTVSFTLQAIGWSQLLLAAFFVLTDIWKFRRGTGLLLLFGQFALTAYLCESVFRTVCFAASDRLFSGFARFFDPKWADMVRAVGFGLIVIAVVVIRRQVVLAKRK